MASSKDHDLGVVGTVTESLRGQALLCGHVSAACLRARCVRALPKP